ncbi:2-amino-4-hydroxy-6-hydroxymethyldihydropteridine diphosphokinase [Dyadobacter sp. BE34]|uniref:2-amino-4-hydroxy-6-hydroxymethyldihydropteridine pyrophosphokinase n=1 Tax=Dyadobacter fermentans TaxID=94254 RepID=A0ABU1R2V1_9BACT|nr:MULTISPECIES: 2-amino-4-hydroxy-6-hydroxymethyldihydropteridine diphosphokinase [Dyadobacter]MDR6807749.1 2-amino-4-hydroxy-6-hydroxymethyldihydropteridine diphosphokinase [Dyadobacter fermentans]MDR7045490.1 2-amino-4-hydroxy-6-hydroxymethyldihydropteridine diphosphokinase [Dyadobacter sp. BE242]MDR7199803.1 2-amino-4-hydroxy-6-hydroxymethyldihydropteridine diphosphokinase [Dyadobacter sp. BE34]MDR7217738.1 2-amino-4-hydroxy-6-hydroxymethyldihydropteridine diphosphokinase [Dyadobacter sp. B
MATTGQVFLLLGSNLGDRPQVLAAAREAIAEQAGSITNQSAIYETAPWGITDQPAFLNQVLEITTSLLPEDLLRIILNIEHDLGRVRYERWGARVIDIDILYFGQTVMDSARLTLPHPRIQDRRFVLAPLAEIAPDFIHPLFQKTSSQLLEQCPDTSAVSKTP